MAKQSKKETVVILGQWSEGLYPVYRGIKEKAKKLFDDLVYEKKGIDEMHISLECHVYNDDGSIESIEIIDSYTSEY